MLALAVLSAGCGTCPVNVFLPPSQRAFNALKNRTTLPTTADLDPRVTLDAMLALGADRRRWQATRAGAIEGYVVRVSDAGRESANCLSGSSAGWTVQRPSCSRSMNSFNATTTTAGISWPPSNGTHVTVTPAAWSFWRNRSAT